MGHALPKLRDVLRTVAPEVGPTDAAAGTNAKIEIMRQRAEEGRPIFHRNDTKRIADDETLREEKRSTPWRQPPAGDP